MKLLLTSAGIRNPSLVKALQELVNKPWNQTNIAYIPTAANVEVGDKSWQINNLVELQQLQLKMLDIIDIAALTKEQWLPRLEAADVLYFSGGDTYYLMEQMNKSGFTDVLPSYLQSKVYVGISAGSMVMCPQLCSTIESLYYNEPRPQVNTLAQNMVNFYVLPHLNRDYFAQVTLNNISNVASKIPQTIYALDDQSAVKVDDESIEVISEGTWEVFNV